MRLVTLLQRRLTRSCSWCVHSVSARSRLRNMLESSLTRSQPSIGRGRNSVLPLTRYKCTLDKFQVDGSLGPPGELFDHIEQIHGIKAVTMKQELKDFLRFKIQSDQLLKSDWRWNWVLKSRIMREQNEWPSFRSSTLLEGFKGRCLRCKFKRAFATHNQNEQRQSPLCKSMERRYEPSWFRSSTARTS